MRLRALAFVLLLALSSARPAFAQQVGAGVGLQAGAAPAGQAQAAAQGPSAAQAQARSAQAAQAPVTGAAAPAQPAAAAAATPPVAASPPATAPVAAAAAAAPTAAPASGRVLTLAQALQSAREHQPLLHQAQAAIDVSRARADQAAAGLYPQVTATAAYQRTTANFAPRPGALPSSVNIAASKSFKTYDYFNFGLNAQQLVWDFGQTYKRKDAAKATLEARKTDEQASLLQVEQNVRVAFFNARAAKAMVSVAHETLANQDKHVGQIEGFVRAGTRAQIDLVQAKADRANAKVGVINAENAYESSKATLDQAMGVEGDTAYDVSDDGLPPVDGEDGALDPLVKRALEHRPEFVSLREQLRSEELTLESIRGGYWPSLGVGAGATEAGRAFNNMTWNVNAGATITWPLFQGGITNAQADEARATLVGLHAQVDALEQQVRLDVTQGQLGVRATKAVLVASQEVVTNARERLRLAEGRYAAGIGNGIELGDAQLALASALAQQVQAEYNLAAARAQLLHALGQQ